MKRFLIATVLASAAVIPAHAADVGISLSIGQPGYYGQIDIGGYPQPQVINRQPVIINRVQADRPPIYLRVPAGHAKHWRRYCGQYNACGERVLFVNDNWYGQTYAPRYRELHRDGRNGGHDEHRDGRHDDHRNDGRDDHRNDEHGGNHDRGR